MSGPETSAPPLEMIDVETQWCDPPDLWTTAAPARVPRYEARTRVRPGCPLSLRGPGAVRVVEPLGKPIPGADSVSGPFWEAANEGRLVIQRCNGCNRLQHPPESLCLRCGSDRVGYVPVSGHGRIPELQHHSRHARPRRSSRCSPTPWSSSSSTSRTTSSC